MVVKNKIFKDDEKKYLAYKNEIVNHLKLLKVPEKEIELMITRYDDLLQVWKGEAHSNERWEKGYIVTPQLAAVSLIKYYVENQKFQRESGKSGRWLPGE